MRGRDGSGRGRCCTSLLYYVTGTVSLGRACSCPAGSRVLGLVLREAQAPIARRALRLTAACLSYGHAAGTATSGLGTTVVTPKRVVWLAVADQRKRLLTCALASSCVGAPTDRQWPRRTGVDRSLLHADRTAGNHREGSGARQRSAACGYGGARSQPDRGDHGRLRARHPDDVHGRFGADRGGAVEVTSTRPAMPTATGTATALTRSGLVTWRYRRSEWEPPVGIEHTTYALRVARLIAQPRRPARMQQPGALSALRRRADRPSPCPKSRHSFPGGPSRRVGKGKARALPLHARVKT
jgi:hypothetical protein